MAELLKPGQVLSTVSSNLPCVIEFLLGSGGQVIGVINLDSDRFAGFDEAALALLVRLTAEATAVMERLWQLRQLEGRSRQLEALITIGQSLVSKLEPQELFDTVTRDFVRQCQTPVLILPDDIPAHPYAVAMEAAMLARAKKIEARAVQIAPRRTGIRALPD